MDILYIALAVALWLLMLFLARACARLGCDIDALNAAKNVEGQTPDATGTQAATPSHTAQRSTT